jgi:hypothetical protein
VTRLRKQRILIASAAVLLALSLSLLGSASAETIPSWSSTTGYPTVIDSQSCAITSTGYIVCVGGINSSTEIDSVYSATVSSSGGVGSWTSSSNTYPEIAVDNVPSDTQSGVAAQSCVAYPASGNQYVACVGGQVGGVESNAIFYAQVSSSGVGTWTASGSYPEGDIDLQSCVYYSGYIYCVGGFYFASDTVYGLSNVVYYAPVSSSGVGSWGSASGYGGVENQSCAVSGGYIYCVGGGSDEVYYASLSSSGGVGTWSSTTNYPTSIANQSCVTSSAYIYCVGGFTGSSVVSTVYYASLSSSGVGTWSSTGQYGSLMYQSCNPYTGGYIYCVGGSTNTAGTGAQSAVDWSKIHSPVASSVAVSCSPTTVTTGSSSTCTATVTGSSPTGTVSWVSSSVTGAFTAGTGTFNSGPPPSCTLSLASCSVSYTDSTSGAPVITASYSGDSNNLGSSGAYILANFATAATAAESTSTSTSGSGAASADQATTGVDVSVSGAPDNTATTVFSSILPSQPPNTGTLSISGIGFYDVQISGITSGTANVCIYNAGVDSTTVLQYYSGGVWVSATGIVDTPGVSICGDIPVSALNGTPLVPGDPAPVPEFPVAWALPVLFIAAVAIYLFARQRTGLNGMPSTRSSSSPP